ncbi:DUF2505 domain-containing protein [Nocardioides alcanivorans]|uniref:DUF2505 domain-containing protein n=1 Tax=Nocardioides alcanivorans TaxID=2897352 RepID=UPI001F1DC954|nr:DUF2505 domain-containing protein [Nocardioides alcanivorans]
MRFEKQIRFPAAVADVHAMLVSKEFREKVAEEAGASSWHVTVERKPEGILSVVASAAPTADLPGFVRKVVGDEMPILQEELYVSETEGQLKVVMTGKPGSLNGTISLAPDGEETVQTVVADVKVSIPLVGGKLERLICQVMGNLLKIQGRVGAEWLSGSR